MTLLDGFLARACLAAVGTALAAAPLGCLLIWRRMAFFSDAAAHAAVLGIAVALIADLPLRAGVLAAALAMALGLAALARGGRPADAVLAVLSHGALAAGIVAVALVPGMTVDLEAYLFGDILTTSRTDLAVIWAGAAGVLALLAWRWQALLTATLHPDLAQAAGIDPERERLVLTIALALAVTIAIETVGALLIAALMVIPAAAARPLARTPERMVAVAAALGVVAALGGIAASWWLDAPTGPAIVCAATALFAATLPFGRRA